MKFPAACLVALFALLARADIAPTTFTGTDIFPLKNTDIRMASAEVRITWGRPCTLEARFAMLNERDSATELDVGFPVGAYHRNHPDVRSRTFEEMDEDPTKPMLEPVAPDLITIAVNGAPVTAYRKLPRVPVRETDPHFTAWYFARISFRPGPNLVTVHTRLQPSPASAPYQSRLSYCVSTGGRWKGPIGWEVVEIAFPGTSAASLLDRPVPKGGKAAGDSVRWEFQSFEPKDREYDIDLDFYPPPIIAKLAELRTAHEKNPADSLAALRYAVHLFCLGDPKGNAGFPPRHLGEAEFQRILGQIGNPEHRAAFTRFYLKEGDRYSSSSTDSTEGHRQIVRILADAGYCQDYAGLPRVLEARRLVEECLARNPRDGDAWQVYLTHFWHFSFAARGHGFGETFFSQPLRTAIASAYKNCPKDPRIRAWHKAMKDDGPAPTTAPGQPGVTPEAFRNEFETR